MRIECRSEKLEFQACRSEASGGRVQWGHDHIRFLIDYLASSVLFLSAAPLSLSSLRYILAHHMAVASPAISPLTRLDPLGSHIRPLLWRFVFLTLLRENFCFRIYFTQP